MESLGRHILVELFGCEPPLLNDVTHIEHSMVKAATDAGLTVINTSFHHFSPFGISGVVVIQESHLSIHTWPEYGFAAVDLFTCGDGSNPWLAHASLKESLSADHTETREIKRGLTDQLPPPLHNNPAHQSEWQAELPETNQRNIWFTRRERDIALSLRHRGQIFICNSDFQKVEILDTYGFGKMLVLDGTVTCTERDEFVYHEMITHVPAQVHPEIHRALVVGGGDGGAARELLRYSTIEHVDVVEIDQAVVQACAKHLPVLADSLSDQRVSLIIDDGVEFLRRVQNGTYDLILVDAVEPAGQHSPAFDTDFYQGVRAALRADGLMVLQTISPALYMSRFRELHNTVAGVFGEERLFCYLALLPTFTTGTASFLLASRDSLDPLEGLDCKAADAFSDEENLHYYSGEIHRAAFALPPHLRRSLES